VPPQSAPSASVPKQPSILLGIGTGCCGLAALAQRLQQQPGAAVSYEDRPLLPWRRLGGVQTLRERFARWRRTRSGRIVGDVGSFYLPYVEEAIALEPEIRIVCLRRPRDEVVRGFAESLDRCQPLPTDHWAETPAARWYHDPVRTRLFPQYPIQDREAGIGRYWDEYHATVEDVALRFPQQLRVFDARRALHSDEEYRELLAFAGLPSDGALADPGLCLDEPGQPPGPRRARRASDHPLDPARCVVLVPFAGQIYPHCERALKELERRGYTVQRVGGYAAIDQGRNQMATDALLAGFEETMWIDADIDFHPDAVERLRSHQQPIVCGIYPQKGKRALACHILPGTERMVFGQGGGLTELLYGATGFLLVRRAVYETMQRVLPLPVCNERFGSPMIPFFQPLSHADGDGHWYLAEDYAFCQRARECGFRILADTTIRLWHLGNYAFGWEDAGMERQRNTTFVLHFPK
jgi:hypothetical protein